VQESALVYNIEAGAGRAQGSTSKLGSEVTSIAAESLPLGRLCPDHGLTGSNLKRAVLPICDNRFKCAEGTG
jgi:hypothetical protein